MVLKTNEIAETDGKLEDGQHIVDHLMFLTVPQIARFLKAHKIRQEDSKKEIRVAVRKALETQKIDVPSIVSYLDEVTPWGKQHVYFFEGPNAKDWRSEKWVMKHLTTHEMDELIDATTSEIILPEELEFSQINWSAKTLRITAIRRREGWSRNEDYDQVTDTPDGEQMELRAFVHMTVRGITALEWDLVSGKAFLQVTQLPDSGSYELARDEFINKLQPCLDLTKFSPVDLGKIIKKRLAEDEKNTPKSQTQSVSWGIPGKRGVKFQAESSKSKLFGNKTLDGMMSTIRRHKAAIPRISGIVFEPGSGRKPTLTDRCHVEVVATKRRVNFTTANTEADFRNVLAQLRALNR